jgi:hypothetical protein
MAAGSRLREVVGQLALELGKITGDHSDVETLLDRLQGLSIKQELERRLDAALRRVRADRKLFGSVSRHGDMMVSLSVSDTDDDSEFERIAFAQAFDFDHGLPSPSSV